MVVTTLNNVKLTGLLLIGVLMMNYTYGQDLKKHQWENRVVLIVSQKEDSKTYQEQITEFNRLPQELVERRIIVYQILPDRYKLMNYQLKEKDIEWITSPTLFDKFVNNKEDFKVILIGLDGGIKLEKTEVLTASELFGTIDAMPMRRAEMKNKNR
ncbi:DUF4174 domain-containing protein [Arenibacter sp. F26102]|uniref:DUF4174 domain-containing protein n=1 Tax=Arenibacter sp. F26102 TaxID=2926416 RepID=UPI001FF13171|nr:DUF4174 domain-containing protein [Arenibacter sp. F26102]MCK0146521.1 DUF4174 domain-containing protein [Arenibacter sp. F26102]